MPATRSLIVLALATLLTLVVAPAARAGRGEPRLPVPWTTVAGSHANNVTPGAPPPGANDWSCDPSARHPNPVILLHGGGSNQTSAWQTFAPLLANNGYCVFSLTYGVPFAPLPGGLLPMEQSARELSVFVDKVRSRTGSAKVDIVGHSAGTIMPSYYVRFLGGGPKVDKYVSLSPLWHGTTQLGISTLYQLSETLGLKRWWDRMVGIVCGACNQFLQGSEFLKKLHARGIFDPAITYTNIMTRYDWAVIPYTSGVGHGPGVRNIVLQDECPLDFAEHGGILADRNAAGHVLNALDPEHAAPVGCVLTTPVGSLLPPR
ncbi:esterase/lipase family protein [Amycolatopsis cihanbeyliensis]|uniref:Triacylglycerol esterase/lipase EstA (Alpha/beta hydrolase family) n=1 Tax=Amycolatopsis cihanbeyliensis TaxID=1128664 RepID=A0A542DQB0_AMYCI|nr:alpha/beta fold hydrolase [Amycolatopsis cihanbeyliensis]TQJ05289.1 triacylglycerol esterase/lipase EstA (alpha/beta hydrolase family) [Amycolatopsis cihanbeyliensis]